MNRLQLATLLSWAGEQGLEGRKRLQKVIYFLQHAGCPLKCDYILHHYGPYSRDVADTCDEMVAAGLVDENAAESGGIKKYRYMLSPKTQALLKQTPDLELEPFKDLGKQLIGESMWPLELGATILYFLGDGDNWDWALEMACKYKGKDPAQSESLEALSLAKQVRKEAA